MKTIEITDQNFKTEVLESDIPVLVDFWAVWCSTCKPLAGILDELAEEFEGRIKIGKLDMDNNQGVPGNLGIRSAPTLLIFKEGRVVDTIIGLVKKSVLSDKLENHLN
jgi:thioredoxin 1